MPHELTKTAAALPSAVNVPLPSAPAKEKSPVTCQDPPTATTSRCSPARSALSRIASSSQRVGGVGSLSEDGLKAPIRASPRSMFPTKLTLGKPGKFGRPCDVNHV